MNSALRYRAQAPVLDALLKEIGLTGGDLNSLTAEANLGKAPPPAEGNGQDRTLYFKP